MGSIVKLKCSNCDYTEQLLLGSGMLDYDPVRIAEQFSDVRDEEAGKLLSETDVLKQWRYDKVLGQCPSCRRIAAVPILIDKKDDTHRIGGICECSTAMRLWSMPEGEYEQTDEMPVCPRCGSRLTSEQAGFWD